ncbi:hypothetical protein MIND_00202400 [Mycena indigotica]|uniref:Uncharacterized protein n=1 Tax=Mycena indigotica TaxID=2126181 RepID=A0A8H6T6P9_9AGAR|nr:uncharacterized protein MIND_00202400 [Mycena indigotica]KAF7311910.1 hypothetical protein MIND_00202400 [Mycena indigotica]
MPDKDEPTRIEIPYTREYLRGRNCAELVRFIDRQSTKWSSAYPYSITDGARTLTAALLNTRNGFTREATPPLPEPEDNSKSDKHFGESDNNEKLDNNQIVSEVNIKVFLDDKRFGGTKRSGIISIAVEKQEINGQDLWCANAQEVLVSMQGSTLKLQGHNVRMLCQDPDDHEFWTVFATFSTDTLDKPTFTPGIEFLPLFVNNQLRLQVESDELTFTPKKRRLSSDSDNDSDDAEQVFSTQDPNAVPLHQAKKRHQVKSVAEQANVAWLEGEISKESGYKGFIRRRGRQMDNQEAIEHWNFIAFVGEKYRDTQLNKTTKKVKNSLIWKALDIGSSTFYAAETASKVLKNHKDSPEIIERLEVEDGSTHLSSFLSKFAKNIKSHS